MNGEKKMFSQFDNNAKLGSDLVQPQDQHRFIQSCVTNHSGVYKNSSTFAIAQS